MSFVSFAFLFLFLFVLSCRLSFGRTKTETPYLFVLTCASLLFYAWHIPEYLLVIIVSTIVDYLAGLKIVRYPRGTPGRKILLFVSLIVNLGMLAFFKYGCFALENVGWLSSWLGFHGSMPKLNLILPLGISFYTFQSMSYTIDVYRGTLSPIRNFWEFFLYVSFFPQLVAGPIVRAKDFLYQIHRKRRLNARVFMEGGYLIIRGFFLKMVIADNLAPLVDRYWASGASFDANPTVSVIVSAFFACQVFCDFAGYSSIARGLAYLLGFRLPVNFNYPFIACTFRDFWARWHISLSQWLQNYLYIPLGGNRISSKRTYLNLTLVMLLGGLWHGAGYTYILWGGVQGVALAVERLLGLDNLDRREHRAELERFVWYLHVQGVFLFSLLIFRSSDISQAFAIIHNIVTGRFEAVHDPTYLKGLIFVIPVALIHMRAYLAENFKMRYAIFDSRPAWAAAMLYLTLTCYGKSEPFIYFQF